MCYDPERGVGTEQLDYHFGLLWNGCTKLPGADVSNSGPGYFLICDNQVLSKVE